MESRPGTSASASTSPPGAGPSALHVRALGAQGPPPSNLRAARGLRDQIAEQLRLEIVRGQLPPGEPLVERKIAARFNVSHAPVREALLQTAHEGLAVAQLNYGVRVAEPPAVELIETLFPARQRLNRIALTAAWDLMSDEHLLWLESCTMRMSAGIARRDAGEVLEGNFFFHRSILEWAEMPQLQAVCGAISGPLHLSCAVRPMDFESAKAWVDQHLALVNALRQRQLNAALETLEANLAAEMRPS